MAAGIVNASLFALAVVRLSLRAGKSEGASRARFGRPGAQLPRIPRSAMFGAAAIVFLIVLGLALIVVASTRRNQPCW